MLAKYSGHERGCCTHQAFLDSFPDILDLCLSLAGFVLRMLQQLQLQLDKSLKMPDWNIIYLASKIYQSCNIYEKFYQKLKHGLTSLFIRRLSSFPPFISLNIHGLVSIEAYLSPHGYHNMKQLAVFLHKLVYHRKSNSRQYRNCQHRSAQISQTLPVD